ncbi:HDOD domain-containing protein [bacterium]|nr:HDOD domain-containing protein [bacterium]
MPPFLSPISKERRALIESWVEKIQEESLPAFSKTVQELSSFVDEDEADLQELSRVIKQDAALSTKILRASNSVYRTRRGRINTISRALVMLGVKEVKKICLSCSLIDGLTEGSPPQEIVDEMSMAFHSATQARLFSLLRGDPHSEEVFLSALMMNIGPLAIWKVAHTEMEEIKALVKSEECPLEEAEEKIFGFILAELSRVLAEKWKLNEFLLLSKEPNEKEENRFKEITLSTALARALPFGWESKVVNGVLVSIQQSIKASPEAILSVLKDASREMVEMATSFGISPTTEPIDGIPESIEATKQFSEQQQKETTVQEIEPYLPVQPNPNFQLESLRNLSSLMASGANPTMYILHTVGGLHRGVGLDRVLFSILNDTRTTLSARLAVGPENEELREQFSFQIQEEQHSFLRELFQENEPFWRQNTEVNQSLPSGSDCATKLLHAEDYFLAPVVVSKKWVGMFYADMLPSGRSLTSELFDSFNQFTIQATIAFQHFEFSKQAAQMKEDN